MLKSLYPVIISEHIGELSQFFQNYFNFSETFVSDWYISLKNGQQEIAFIYAKHETIPATYRAKTQNLLINLEVDKVDPIYQLFNGKTDYPILLPIKSEAFGQRHFIIEVCGLMLDVIQEIEPSPEFLEQYK